MHWGWAGHTAVGEAMAKLVANVSGAAPAI
jgi:hypothetical protein